MSVWSACTATTNGHAGACRQLRPGGHLTRICCAPVLTAIGGRSAPVLANARQLTRQATIDDTPGFRCLKKDGGFGGDGTSPPTLSSLF
jgi:hypothetical protein